MRHSITLHWRVLILSRYMGARRVVNGANASPHKKNHDAAARPWHAVRHTGNITHVYLPVTDPIQQQQFIGNGLERRMDPKGKKNKKAGILFPLGHSAANEKHPPGRPPAETQLSLTAGPADHYGYLNAGSRAALDTALAAQREMLLTGF